MFEKFLSEGNRDFSQRYLNTYGFFRRSGKKLLTRLISIDNVVRFVDKDEVVYTLNPDSTDDVGFEFLPPKAGWHNTPQGGLLVKRIANRQWKRGICSANTRIGTPLGHRAEVGFVTLSQIYEKDTPVVTALKQDPGKTTGFVALSEQFAMNKDKLFCLEAPIGSVKRGDTNFNVKLDNPDFWRTEVKDAFTRSNLEVVIS